jgi:hypothetical protein
MRQAPYASTASTYVVPEPVSEGEPATPEKAQVEDEHLSTLEPQGKTEEQPEESSTSVDEERKEPEPAEAQTMMVEAYCVRCRQKRPLAHPEKTTTKNGRQAVTGVCPECGTKLFRFVSGNRE